MHPPQGGSLHRTGSPHRTSHARLQVRCTNARPVLAGLEPFGPSVTKINNGVLMAAPNSSFLALWRRSYSDYRPNKWDYNSCERSYALAQAL